MLDNDKLALRARDFWGSTVIIATSAFFLFETSSIPLFAEQAGGVAGIEWYDSAAIVPLCIFTALLLLGLIMMTIAIRDGGAKHAFSSVGLGWNRFEAIRIASIGICLTSYIFALVPRGDFIICSALLLTCLIWGFASNSVKRMGGVAATMALAGMPSLFLYFERDQWGVHNDDWFCLGLWLIAALTIMFQDRASKLARYLPVISVAVPLTLVAAMAFGFRQNVPMRTGLLFQQIEYHWFVTLPQFWGA